MLAGLRRRLFRHGRLKGATKGQSAWRWCVVGSGLSDTPSDGDKQPALVPERANPPELRKPALEPPVVRGGGTPHGWGC